MSRVCIDIGGTFTDCVVLDSKGNLNEFKAPSTPSDFSQGVINALEEAAKFYSQSLTQFIGQIEFIVHGTTVATNAVVTRDISRTAMITTKGFRDILEMRRALKIETHSMYEAMIPPYEPIVPRYLRFTVNEETRYTGEITVPVNEKELKTVIERIKKEGIEAVSICFINSYANPENEKKAAQICSQELKGVFVTYSSEILPKMGEYERESTSVINACIGPIVTKYLTSLEEKLDKAGFKGQLTIMQANQFTQSVSSVKQKPAYLVGSGPAAAPAGGAYVGKIIGEENIITVDMGGTTLDASLINKGKITLTSGSWLEDEILGIKVADVESVGAGGGSIASIGPLGFIQVGPQSAGADPGPVCYGRGGKKPTVTDAAVILGYIPSDYFWGGKLKLDVDLAKQSVKEIADKMKMTVEEAAEAIFTTVNSNMADEVTEISTRKGLDIRDFSLLSVGGGGALCGAFIADLLSMPKVIVPRFSASFCAWSMFSLDIGRDYVRSYICSFNDANVDTINELYEDMKSEAISEFEALELSEKDMILDKYAEVRYLGQYHEVEMSLDTGKITSKDIEKLTQEFHDKHKSLYTFSMPWLPIEFQTLRLIVRSKTKKVDIKKIAKGTEDASVAIKRKRPCFFHGNFIDTAVYDGPSLKAGNIIMGPGIVEEPVTTLVIPKGFQCDIDDYGNYILRRL